jgi:hypothetical protein
VFVFVSELREGGREERRGREGEGRGENGRGREGGRGKREPEQSYQMGELSVPKLLLT